MIVKALVENTTASDDLGFEHGLSIYVETKKHKMLFDVGAGNLFYENAKVLGVNVSEIDYLIISHGHYDHGGGLKAFLDVNEKAEVFVHSLAFGKHYSLKNSADIKDIGLDKSLIGHKQIVLTQDRFFIGMGMQLFTNSVKQEPQPKSNAGLMRETAQGMEADDFSHEQNLIVEEDGKTLLITGCAHNGIINILEQFNHFKDRPPDVVIGGFHLSSRKSSGGNEFEDDEVIEKIGEYLMRTGTKYYTGHCTGIEPYNQLKGIMGDSIEYLSTGTEFVI